MYTALSLLSGVVHDMFWAAIPAIGFGMLFNLPLRLLPMVAVLGAIGHGLRWMGVEMMGWSIVSASFMGALAIGFLSVFFARHWKIPKQLFGVAGVIPMIPGVFAFKTMLGLVELATHKGVANTILLNVAIHATQTGMILGALALGITAPALLLERQKPVV